MWAVAVVMLMAGVLVVGCQTAAKGPSDADQVKAVVEKWKAAVPAKNIDGVMALYSANFESAEYGDKAGLKAFLSDAIDQGYMDNGKASSTNMELKLEDGAYKVYPLEVSGTFGSATVELMLMKEKGNWMITGMSIEMQ
jgi:ketosteroid isomerase-like protein